MKSVKSTEIDYLYKIFKGNTVNDIHPAPDKFLMKKYGGSLSQDEFRKLIIKTPKIYKKEVFLMWMIVFIQLIN